MPPWWKDAPSGRFLGPLVPSPWAWAWGVRRPTEPHLGCRVKDEEATEWEQRMARGVRGRPISFLFLLLLLLLLS